MKSVTAMSHASPKSIWEVDATNGIDVNAADHTDNDAYDGVRKETQRTMVTSGACLTTFVRVCFYCIRETTL